MFEYTELREKLATYLSQEQVELVTNAYLMAAKAHENQKRYSGEPYITHPIEVANIVANMRMDYQGIIAALLHDTIEDTSVDKQEIQQHFGDKIAELVDGLSKLEKIHFESTEAAQGENFRKMMLAMIQDVRIIIIKLADRLHNMRTLDAFPQEKKRRISLETLEIYAPIAHRLGMNTFKVEFEELGFMNLYPLRYQVLKEWVRKSRGNRKALVSTVKEKIQAALQSTVIEAVMIEGREKYLYSLYKKMKAKRLSFSEVLDIYAFRIVVDNRDACYRALGMIHGLYRPVPGRFKDYIAIPKSNGYQSLHSTLYGPYGIPIEIQIRTKEMDQIARNGVAAHWRYKTNSKVSQLKTGEWFKGLLDIQSNTKDPLEFIENVKIDLYPEAVYVFTPNGKILSLPQGATPIDYAYLVHTDIGNHCIACKINRRLAPLSTRLENGQTVDIITAPNAQPNPAWLSFAITAKARTNVRYWLRNKQRSESRALGIRLIHSVLLSYGQSETLLSQLPVEKIKAILLDLKVESLDLLYEEVGVGKRLAPLVAQVILKNFSLYYEQIKHMTYEEPEPLSIRGTEGLVVSYADCCYPIPEDLIIGHLIEDQGVMIHTEACEKIAKIRKKSQNFINVQWSKDIDLEFKVPIEVDAKNEKGVLGLLATSIAEANAKIIDVIMGGKEQGYNCLRFIILVKDRVHLANVLRRLRVLAPVSRVNRAKET